MPRRPSVATSLCMQRAVSEPVKDRGKRHPKLRDASAATAKPKFCTPKLGQPQIRRTVFRSLEVLVGEDSEPRPSLTEMTCVSGEMNSVTRCWRGRTDTSAPKRTTSSRSSPCGRERPCTHPAQPVALSVKSARSVRHCGRILCRQPFIKAHLFLSSGTPISSLSLIRDAHLCSLSSLSEAHPTPPLNLCASQKDF